LKAIEEAIVELQEEKLESERKKKEYQEFVTKAIENEKQEQIIKNEQEKQKTSLEHEEQSLSRQLTALRNEWSSFLQQNQQEKAKVKAFNIVARSCEWHEYGHMNAFIKIDGHSVGAIGRGINIAIFDKYTGELHGRFRSFDTCGNPSAGAEAAGFIHNHYRVGQDLLVAISADEMSTHGSHIHNYLHNFGAHTPTIWRQAWSYVQEKGEIHSSPHPNSEARHQVIELPHHINHVAERHAHFDNARRIKEAEVQSREQSLEANIKIKREATLKIKQDIRIIDSKILQYQSDQKFNKGLIAEEERNILSQIASIKLKEEIIANLNLDLQKFVEQQTKLVDSMGIETANDRMTVTNSSPQFSDEEILKVSLRLKGLKDDLVRSEQELLRVRDKITESTTNLNNLEFYIERKRKQLDNELEVNRKIIAEYRAELELELERVNVYTEIDFLLNQQIFTGYDSLATENIRKIVEAVIPNIIGNSFEQYRLGGKENKFLLPEYSEYIELIIKKIKETSAGETELITAEILSDISRLINNEFQSDGRQIQIKLVDGQEEIKASDSFDPTCEKLIDIQLVKKNGVYLRATPVEEVLSAYEYVYKLIGFLIFDEKELQKSFFLENYEESFQGRFKECPIEELLKVYTELDARIANAKNFNEIINHVQKKEEYQNYGALLVTKILNKIKAYVDHHKVDSEEEGEKISDKQISVLLDFTKKALLKNLLDTTQKIIGEREQEDAAALESLDDPIKKLEKLIALKTQTIEALKIKKSQEEQKVKHTEERIEDLEKDLKAIKLSYDKQLSEIQEEIKLKTEELEKSKKKFNEMVAKGDDDQVALTEQEKIVNQHDEYVTALKEKQKQIVREYNAAINECYAYEKDHIITTGEKNAIVQERTDVTKWRNEEEKKLLTLKALFGVAKEVYKRFQESKDVFRHIEGDKGLRKVTQTLATVEGTFEDRLTRLYNILESLEGFKQLDTRAQEEKDKLSLADAIKGCDMFIFDEIVVIIQQCIAKPQVKWIFSERRCEVTGFNLGFKEIKDILRHEVESLVFPLGLSFNGNQLVVNGDG
ncbi:MAG: hypothetical protein WCP46_06560, partial [Alphaproteobacteria bacterium]